MDAFAATVEALASASARARPRLMADWVASLDEPDRSAARSLLNRAEACFPTDLVARLPGIEPAARSLSMSEAVTALDALAAERSPSRKLERLARVLGQLTRPAARCFLLLATGPLRLDEEARPPLGTLAVVVTRVTGRRATLAVRGREGFVEVGQALLPDDERLASLIDLLVIEREGDRRWLRPEIVLEVSFEAVRRDARWSSGYALAAPTALRWLSDRQPFAVDMIERVEAFHEQSKVSTGPRTSAPPPLKSRRVDDLPLFGRPDKSSQE